MDDLFGYSRCLGYNKLSMMMPNLYRGKFLSKLQLGGAYILVAVQGNTTAPTQLFSSICNATALAVQKKYVLGVSMSQFWPFLFFFCSATLVRVAKKKQSAQCPRSFAPETQIPGRQPIDAEIFSSFDEIGVETIVQINVYPKSCAVHMQVARGYHVVPHIRRLNSYLVRYSQYIVRIPPSPPCYCLTRRSVLHADTISIVLNDGREIRCIADGEAILATAISIIIRDHQNSQPFRSS